MGSRRTTSTASAEQKAADRRAKAEQMQAQIAAQVEAMAESTGWREWLDYLANFHSYSTGRVAVFDPANSETQEWRSAA